MIKRLLIGTAIGALGAGFAGGALAEAVADSPKDTAVEQVIGMVEIATRLGGLSALGAAAKVALLHRIEIAEESGLSPEAVVEQLCEESKKKALRA